MQSDPLSFYSDSLPGIDAVLVGGQPGIAGPVLESEGFAKPHPVPIRRDSHEHLLAVDVLRSQLHHRGLPPRGELPRVAEQIVQCDIDQVRVSPTVYSRCNLDVDFPVRFVFLQFFDRGPGHGQRRRFDADGFGGVDVENMNQSTFTLPFRNTSFTFCTPLCGALNVRDFVSYAFQPPVEPTVRTSTFVLPTQTSIPVSPPPLATFI